jgi:hypothetical protein
MSLACQLEMTLPGRPRPLRRRKATNMARRLSPWRASPIEALRRPLVIFLGRRYQQRRGRARRALGGRRRPLPVDIQAVAGAKVTTTQTCAGSGSAELGRNANATSARARRARQARPAPADSSICSRRRRRRDVGRRDQGRHQGHQDNTQALRDNTEAQKSATSMALKNGGKRVAKINAQSRAPPREVSIRSSNLRSSSPEEVSRAEFGTKQKRVAKTWPNAWRVLASFRVILHFRRRASGLVSD